jgi:hypothetical protein
VLANRAASCPGGKPSEPDTAAAAGPPAAKTAAAPAAATPAMLRNCRRSNWFSIRVSLLSWFDMMM